MAEANHLLTALLSRPFGSSHYIYFIKYIFQIILSNIFFYVITYIYSPNGLLGGIVLGNSNVTSQQEGPRIKCELGLSMWSFHPWSVHFLLVSKHVGY